jgi:hypothetical protein
MALSKLAKERLYIRLFVFICFIFWIYGVWFLLSYTNYQRQRIKEQTEKKKFTIIKESDSLYFFMPSGGSEYLQKVRLYQAKEFDK